MSHQISHQNGVMVISLIESITPADLHQIGESLQLVDTTFTPLPDRLIDLRTVKQVDVTFEAVKAFAGHRNDCTLRHAVRAAILAPDDLHFGMARMFKSLSENPRIHLQIFRDYASALSWLSSKIEET